MSLGSRGGSTGSLDEAERLFVKWKQEEYGWLKARILWLAEKRGEFHADQLEDVELTERNIIGACVNGLVRGGYLVSTGEHRRGQSEASHGRRSYVYRLTQGGTKLASAIHNVPRESLPVRPKAVRESDAQRPRSRRKLIEQDTALFEELDDHLMYAPIIEAPEEEKTPRGQRRKFAVRPRSKEEVDKMVQRMGQVQPYRTPEQQAKLSEFLETSPFLGKKPQAPLSWDAD